MDANKKREMEAVQYKHFAIVNNELNYGPVKVVKGKYAGRIGCYDDSEGAYGFVYWGDMVLTMDSCSKIKLSYLSNVITTYDMINRATKLQHNIALARLVQKNMPILTENVLLIYMASMCILWL